MNTTKKYKKAYLEITNVCNLKCTFCPKTKRAPRFITIAEFETALQKMKPYMDFLNLHVMGEPTLHKNLPDFLKLAEREKIPVNITTNGTLLKGELAEILLRSNSLNKVNVSLHSFEANDENINMNDYLDWVLDFALRASKSPKLITALRLWNLDGNKTQGENEENEHIFSLLEHKFNLTVPIGEQYEIARRNSPKMLRGIKLAPRTFLQLAEKFEWPDLSAKERDGKAFCYGLRDHFAVLCDGTVVPCCLDHEGDIALGNLFTENADLGEILASPRAMGMYNGFSGRRAVEELCKKCGYIDRFSRG